MRIKLIISIRKRLLKSLGYIMNKDGLENMIFAEQIEGNGSIGKQPIT